MTRCISRVARTTDACRVRLQNIHPVGGQHNRFLATSSESSSSTSSNKLGEKLRDLWNSGTILMGLGGAGIALLVIDRTLQYFDRQEAKQIMASIQEEQAQKQIALFDKHKNTPSLFECTVKIAYKMGGTHGLKDVKEGQVVQVLEQAVGPQGHYNLCRTVDEQGNPVSIGWYPISYLEKKKRWWQLW